MALAEQVQPGGRERRTGSGGGETRPVLSRYARQRSPAPEAPAADHGEDAREETEPGEAPAGRVEARDAAHEAERPAPGDGDGVEISPPSPELPPPPSVAQERASAESGADEPETASGGPSTAGSHTAGPPGSPSPGPAPAPSPQEPGATEAVASAAASPSPSAEATGPARPGPDARTRAQGEEPAEDATAPGAERGAEPSTHATARAGSAEEPVRRVEASHFDSPERVESRWAREIVPSSRPRTDDDSPGRKVPLWKRIALPLVQSAAAATQGERAKTAPASRPASLEPVLTRLSALEKQLAANQSATEGQLARFEENITRLWELEEQLTLTEVRERLALLEANQEEIADGLHAVGRNLVLVAVVLAAGIAAGLLALGLLL